jgi:hypothetical protein
MAVCGESHVMQRFLGEAVEVVLGRVMRATFFGGRNDEKGTKDDE